MTKGWRRRKWEAVLNAFGKHSGDGKGTSLNMLGKLVGFNCHLDTI